MAHHFTHRRFRALERVAQLDQIGEDSFDKRAFDLLWRDVIVADEECNVRHVLRIVAAHHLGEDQIGRGGAEESQPARRRMGDGNEVLFPIAAEEDLVGSEEMGDVETFRTQFMVRLFLRFPEASSADS